LTELRTGFDKQTLFKMPLPLHSKWEHSIILISTPPVSYYGASQSNNLLHKSFLEYKIIDEKYCSKADLWKAFMTYNTHQCLTLYYNCQSSYQTWLSLNLFFINKIQWNNSNRHLCETFRYQDKSAPQLGKSALVFFLKIQVVLAVASFWSL
jgi:hypothetical protein